MLLVGTDGGLFDLSGPTPRQSLAGHEVTAVARAGDAWWVLVDGHTLVHGQPAEGWREVADLSPLDVRGHCLLPRGDGVLVGTSGAHLARYDTGHLSLVDSFDAIEGRDEWYTPWGEPPDVRSLAADGDELFVNVHVGGVWASRDADGWECVVDVDADTHQVWAGGGDVVVAAAVGVGHRRPGSGWEWSTEGLHGAYCRAVARTGDGVLVSASTGPFTDRAAVYRRAMGETEFQRCRDGLPEWFDANVDSHTVASSDGQAAIGTASGGVYRSHDGGGTWMQVTAALPPVRCVTF